MRSSSYNMRNELDGDLGRASVQERSEHGVRIEVSLGAVTAAHFARDDGRANRSPRASWSRRGSGQTGTTRSPRIRSGVRIPNISDDEGVDVLLSAGLGKLPIRRPSVAHKHAREVRPEDGGGLGKAAAGLNTIVVVVAKTQSHCNSADLPARFIRPSDCRGPWRRARYVTRVGCASPSSHTFRDLPKRQAELLIEDHPERGRLRPEPRPRRRVHRTLERVASLHPLPAALAPSDVDVKGADPHARDREFLLILCRDAGLDHRRLTRRARGGQGRVDVGRHASTRRAAVRGAGLPPGALRIPLRRLGKRRRLAIAGTPRRIQLSFEPIDLRPQPLILAAQRISVLRSRHVPPSLGSGGVSSRAR